MASAPVAGWVVWAAALDESEMAKAVASKMDADDFMLPASLRSGLMVKREGGGGQLYSRRKKAGHLAMPGFVLVPIRAGGCGYQTRHMFSGCMVWPCLQSNAWPNSDMLRTTPL